MTVTVFVGSLLGAMALGMPIAYALLVCGLALMAFMAATGALHSPAALSTAGAWISPAVVLTPRTRSPASKSPVTAVSSRIVAPAARAPRANPCAVSTGLQ